MTQSEYDWNVHVQIGGVSFHGPGMETRSEAETIADTVRVQSDSVQKVEVIEQ